MTGQPALDSIATLSQDAFLVYAVLLYALCFSTHVLVLKHPFAPRWFWALFDVFVNGLTAMLVVLPMVARNSRGLPFLIGAFALAVALDVDHFVAARSLSLAAALTLSRRPCSHSLTLAFTLAVALYALSGSLCIGWGAFAALASHILRDAADGITPLLWPLKIQAIPRQAYYFAVPALALLSQLFSEAPCGSGA
jgi:hypothetical protein